MLWNPTSFDVVVLKYDPCLVYCIVKSKKKKEFLCSFVYTCHNPSRRDKVWNLLRNIAVIVKEPWLVVEDFNSYLFSHEKNRVGLPNFYVMRRFADCLCDCCLQDLGFVGLPFTWERGGVKERSNRAVFNDHLRDLFLDVQVHHLSTLKSNQKLILVKMDGDRAISNGAKPFRFLTAWLEDSSFRKVIKEV